MNTRPAPLETPWESRAEAGRQPEHHQALSTAAKLYLGAVYGTAAGAAGLTIAVGPKDMEGERVVAFVLLMVLSAGAQLFKVDAPNRQSYHITPAFLLAGVLLLDPVLLVPMVVLAMLPEWVRFRYPWYIQTFNICTYLLNVLVAWAVFQAVAPEAGLGSSWRAAAATAGAAATFGALNHGMVALVLWLARGIRPRESQVLSWQSLETDLALLAVGVGMATFWTVNPPLVALGMVPLFLFYRALFVPQLEEQAHYDAKTGLLTARRFMDLLSEELDRLAKEPKPTSVIMADLDLLRNINNSLGHLAGDEVLRTVAAVLKGSVRCDDIVGRFGGEEFVLLLRNTDAQSAMRVAERVRAAVESTPVAVPGVPTPVQVTMSLGVASFPDPCTDPQQLLHYADLAVYQSKVNGRNRVSLAHPGLEDSSISGRGYRDILESLAFALDARGAAVDGRTLRVTALSLAVAREMGIREGSQEWKDLERGSLLHDVGKLAIPSAVLYKQGPLAEEEWAVVKQHPEIGWAMLRQVEGLWGAAEIVRAHHEHYDGSGYPNGLRGEEIPLAARILAVVDAFDAITSDRPYREAQSEEIAIREIMQHRGTQFDPEVVDSLLRVLGRRVEAPAERSPQGVVPGASSSL